MSLWWVPRGGSSWNTERTASSSVPLKRAEPLASTIGRSSGQLTEEPKSHCRDIQEMFLASLALRILKLPKVWTMSSSSGMSCLDQRLLHRQIMWRVKPLGRAARSTTAETFFVSLFITAGGRVPVWSPGGSVNLDAGLDRQTGPPAANCDGTSPRKSWKQVICGLVSSTTSAS